MLKNPFDEIAERLSRIENCLLDFKDDLRQGTIKVDQLETDRWFDINELCHYHPAKPCKATVYTWVRERRIPFHKRGKKLAFLKSEIDSNIKTGKVKSIAEIEEDAENFLINKKEGIDDGKEMD